jgi:hypothetical protein
MSKMFDTMYDQINIRFFEPLNKSLQITDFDKSIKFRIKIRHCENETAEEVYKNASNKLTKGGTK